MRLARERLTVRAPDGAELSLLSIAPPEPAVAACLVGHAMMTNGRSLDRRRRGLASSLARAGFHVYVLDFRGHGDSRAPAGADWCFEELVTVDLPCALEAVRERHGELPLVGVGHSLAGVAMLAYLGRRADGGLAVPAPPALDALVTVCANVWLPSLDPSRRRRAGKGFITAGLRVICAVNGEFPARRVRMGTDPIPRGFARDLRRWWRSGEWRSQHGHDYLAALAGVRVPVLAVFGGGDGFFCNPRAGEAFHEALGRPPERTLTVDASVAGYDPGHVDIVMDPRNAPAWQSIERWAHDRIRSGSLHP